VIAFLGQLLVDRIIGGLFAKAERGLDWLLLQIPRCGAWAGRQVRRMRVAARRAPPSDLRQDRHQ
jgi:hypothetical protein